MSDNLDQADEATIYAINLQRVSAGLQSDATKVLEAVEKDIVGKIVAEGLDGTTAKGKRYSRLLTAVDKSIKTGYSQIKSDQEKGLVGVAKLEGKQATKLINKQIGVDIAQPLSNPEQLEAVVKDAVVLGNSSKGWWDKQDKGMRDEFKRQMQIGTVAGESVEQLTERVKGVNGLANKSKRQAEALVRSSVQSVSNSARLKTFEKSSDIVKGIKWISTLDGRTTHICISLDGLQWRLPDYKPVKHGKSFPGPTAHWNCRSTQVAVVRGWDELSKKKLKSASNQDIETAIRKRLKEDGKDEEFINQAVKKTRASMDGQTNVDQDFEQWASKKPPEFLKKKLGAGRFELWNSGKISLKQLTDQKVRPLSVAQLANMVETGKDEPDEGLDFLGISQAQLDAISAGGGASAVMAGLSAFKAVSAEHAEAYEALMKDPGFSPEEVSLPEALEQLETKLNTSYALATLSVKDGSANGQQAWNKLTPLDSFKKLSTKEKLDAMKAEAAKLDAIDKADASKAIAGAAIQSGVDVEKALDQLVEDAGENTAKSFYKQQVEALAGDIEEDISLTGDLDDMVKKWDKVSLAKQQYNKKFGSGFNETQIQSIQTQIKGHIEKAAKIEEFGKAAPQSVQGKAWKALKQQGAGQELTVEQKLNILNVEQGKAVANNKKVATITQAKKKMVKDGEFDIDLFEGSVAWNKLKGELDASELQEIVDDAMAKAQAKAVPKVSKELDVEGKNLDQEVPPVSSMKVVKSLPGSTSPDLMVDPLGKQWVVKSKGTFVEHRENESAIDNVYRAAGAASPFSTMQDGKKVAEFIDGGVPLSSLTGADFNKAKKQLRENFALDALLDNWDVAGLTGDNTLYAQGKAWRIDNGGAGKYRAQGQPKPTWKSDDITSFDTLRDPSTNEWGAKVFKGITNKEIKAQLASIDLNRDKIFSSLPEPERKVVLGKLELAKKRFGVETQTAKEKEVVDAFGATFTKSEIQAVKDARSNGAPVVAGFNTVEDGHILAWEEYDTDGTPLTMLDFKLTPKSQASLVGTMEPHFKSSGAGVPESTETTSRKIKFETDNDATKVLEDMSKTLHTHAGDKKYNPTTVQKYLDLEKKFKEIEKSGKDGLDADAAKWYGKFFEDISTAYETQQKPVEWVTPYVAPVKAKTGDEAKAPPAPIYKIEKEKSFFKNPLKTYENGRGTRTGATEQFGARPHYNIEADGVKVRYVPLDATAYDSKEVGNTFRVANIANANRVTVEVRGEVSQETVDKAVQTLAGMGVDLTPPTPEQKAYVYHKKLLGRTLPRTQASAEKFAKWDEEAEKGDFKSISRAMKTKFGKDFKDHPDYNPDGKAIGAFGQGHRVFNRIDVPDEIVKDYRVYHSTADIPDFVQNVLNQGGVFTPTTGRQRKGIQISGTGASPETDLNTGGADFTFTRIKKKAMHSPGQYIYFKPEILKRADALQYTQDSWGAQNEATKKQRLISDPQKWKNIKASDNETIFKNGMDLIGDVEEIRLGSESSKEAVIKAYKEAGLATLPDGRDITTIVKTIYEK